MKEITEKELLAVKKVLELLNIIPTEENVKFYYTNGYITVDTAKDGSKYCWYLDSEKEVCISIDTLQQVNPKEVGLC